MNPSEIRAQQRDDGKTEARAKVRASLIQISLQEQGWSWRDARDEANRRAGLSVTARA